MSSPSPALSLCTGDGAGILCSIPFEFFRRAVQEEMGLKLPKEGKFGIGQIFLPTDEADREKAKALFEEVCKANGHKILAWRKVPTDNSMIGPSALAVEPYIEQVFVTLGTAHDHLSREQQVRSASPYLARAPRCCMNSLRVPLLQLVTERRGVGRWRHW